MDQRSGNFQIAHAFTAKWEGGFSDHPDDRGGVTNYGVCIEFLKDLAAKKDDREFLASLGVMLPVSRQTVAGLSKEQARAIFRYAFWDRLELDCLGLRPAVVLYDMAVNHGPKRGVRLAQAGFNALGPKERLVENGIMGPKTRRALSGDSLDAALAMIGKRRDYYRSIAAGRPSQKVFLKGWLNRANDLEKYARSLK